MWQRIEEFPYLLAEDRMSGNYEPDPVALADWYYRHRYSNSTPVPSGVIGHPSPALKSTAVPGIDRE
jgi:hypothetical protein